MNTDGMHFNYTYTFEFTYFIPGGFGPTRKGNYSIGSDSKNYAESVNKFNKYCAEIFHNAVTIEIQKITRKKNPMPF